MKSQKGVTLTSLLIYVVAMVIIIGIVGTITSFFYSNTADMNESATNLGEFNNFNYAFLTETKKEGNSVHAINEAGNRIIFSSGTVFTFQDGGIYQDKIKICTGVTNCQFSTRMQEEKQIVTALIEIGTKVPFVKTVEYVMNYSNMVTTSDLESDYSQVTTDEYVQNGLQLHYDAINNTGNGHSNTTTTWKDLSGNHRDGVVTDVTWSSNYAKFNGTSSWVNCGEMNYDNVTIEVIASYDYIFLDRETDLVSNFDNGGYGILSMDNNGIRTHRFSVMLENGFQRAISNEKIQTGKKYFLYGVYDGSLITLYENDNKYQITIANENIIFPWNNTPMTIGINADGNQGVLADFTAFLGNIYAVRIYNRALTEQEVMHNYEIDKERYGI